LILPERIDQQVRDRAEPAFQVSPHLALDREGSHWATPSRGTEFSHELPELHRRAARWYASQEL
jgi:ATP/maltotriose-dependent transcriptional regulator MalT